MGSRRRTVIQGRFKLPGMRFSLLGINALLRLRNAYFSFLTQSFCRTAITIPCRSMTTMEGFSALSPIL